VGVVEFRVTSVELMAGREPDNQENRTAREQQAEYAGDHEQTDVNGLQGIKQSGDGFKSWLKYCRGWRISQMSLGFYLTIRGNGI
jgi:hypothetical protein